MAGQFLARYGDAFIAGQDGHDVLAMMATLLQHATVEILQRPCDRELLPDTAAMIRADLTPGA